MLGQPIESRASKLVARFHRASKQPVRTNPTTGSADDKRMRLLLLREEVEELAEALAAEDIVEVADALGDILYVTYGAAHVFGIPLDPVLEEIHRSNMTKFGPNGRVYYRDDGKVTKSPHWEPPVLGPIIDRGLQSHE